MVGHRTYVGSMSCSFEPQGAQQGICGALSVTRNGEHHPTQDARRSPLASDGLFNQDEFYHICILSASQVSSRAAVCPQSTGSTESVGTGHSGDRSRRLDGLANRDISGSEAGKVASEARARDKRAPVNEPTRAMAAAPIVPVILSGGVGRGYGPCLGPICRNRCCRCGGRIR